MNEEFNIFFSNSIPIGIGEKNINTSKNNNYIIQSTKQEYIVLNDKKNVVFRRFQCWASLYHIYEFLKEN
jgi:hypothetical protein